jgi:hypothetical protein
MTKIIFDFDMVNKKEVVDELTLACIKYNYPDFVAEFGHEKADSSMSRMFGTAWEKSKEQIWQWFDEVEYGIK